MKKILTFIFALIITIPLTVYGADTAMDSFTDDSASPVTTDYLIGYSGTSGYRWSIASIIGLARAASNGTSSSGYMDFYEDADNGSSYFRLYGPEALDGNVFFQLPPTSGTTGGQLYFSAANKLGVIAAGTENQLWIMGATIPGWAAVPTWNQNTTGSAASLSISGKAGSLIFTGLDATRRAKTVRDAADTILELGGSYTPTGTWNWTSATWSNVPALPYLASTVLDDTKGNGDTAFVWSADKVFDQLAGKQATVTEGSLTDSTIVSADIKNGEIAVADLATADFGDFSCNGTACTLDVSGSFAVTDITGQTDNTTPATTATAVLAQGGSLIESTLAQIATAIGVVDWTADQGTTNIHAGNVVIPVPTTITVADTTDTTSYVGLFESATGDLGPKTDGGITYNAGTGMLTVTGLTAGTGGVTVSKQSGVAGDMSVYEANSTDTHGAGFRGPASITGDGAYRILFPNARASSANMVLAVTNAGESGDGAAATPYVQTGSWIDLDDKLNASVISTLTNTKWCSTNGTVITCTEDAPAGSGDITAVGSCATGSCATIGNADASGGYIDFLEDSDNGTNYVRLQAPASTADVTVTLPNAAGTLALTSQVISQAITGYSSGAGTVADTDTILQAINKLNGNTAAKQATVTEGSLADSVIVSADIKNGEIVVADLATAEAAKLNRYHQTAHVDPNEVYSGHAGIIVLDPKTPAAITITEIAVYLDEDPTTELTITCYHKTAAIGYTGGTQIDANDTASGTFAVTSSFDDATVPAGSKIWCLIGDDPDATNTDLEIAITATYD